MENTAYLNLSFDGFKNFNFPHKVNFLFYTPLLKIEVKGKSYTLKTASEWSELESAFKLRQQVFFPDSEENILDCDRFDSNCDHIIIQDNKTSEVIGTYRILNGQTTLSYYSETEFEIDDFLALEANKIELGRACISPKHRNGVVLDLLWKGIALYAKKSCAKYLFGCSSIMTTSPLEASNIYTYMKQNNFLFEDYGIKPIGKYKTKLPRANKEFIDEITLPPLLKSYLRAGAKVYGKPAYDKEFMCFDFFTVIDLHNVNPLFKRRYFS